MCQSIIPDEILIIDNGDSPNLNLIAEHYSARVVRFSGFGKGRLRNFAFKQARNELVIFIDDDAMAEPHWLQRLLETTSNHENVAVVTGPAITHGTQWTSELYNNSKKSRLWRAAFNFYDKYIMLGQFLQVGVKVETGGFSIGGALAESKNVGEGYLVSSLSTCNALIRRSAFESVNGFDEEFYFNNEDGDFFDRVRNAGGKIFFNPSVVVHHKPSIGQKSRSTPFYDGWDYGRYLFKSCHPKSPSERLGFVLNIVWLHLFWIFKGAKNRNINQLLAFYGFWASVKKAQR